MTSSRRRFIQGGTALLGAPWLLLRDARGAYVPRFALAANEPRFALGIASGQPHADGMVLWTRLTGADLPERVAVSWEIAHDERFQRIAAKGSDVAEAASAHSVHAEPTGLAPGRWYWYRFEAMGQQSMVGRTRTAPAADSDASLAFAIASCQRWDVGRYAAWRDIAEQDLDLVMFLGDYIYESVSKPGALRTTTGPVRTLAEYRARYALHKSDSQLQAAHAAMPWLLVWDDHEVENDYAGLQGAHLQPDFAQKRAAAYQAYWEHMPFPKSARPQGGEMRITGRLDWGRLARIHLLDDRQYRDPQACPKPGHGGANTLLEKECPALRDPKRTLLGERQERWLAEGWDAARPWNLVAQQTLMARCSWRDTLAGGGMYWTDGWDGYPLARQRLLDGIKERQAPGVVVLGGDVHSNYVADLKLDFDDPKSPTIATEFCGTSITSLGLAQDRIDAARGFNPHIHYGRSDQRGYVRFALERSGLQAALRVVERPEDAASSVVTAARFFVDPKRPGAVTAG